MSKLDWVLTSRRGGVFKGATRRSVSDMEHGQLREKLVRALTKAVIPGRQTQRQVADAERKAQKAFGDVCRRWLAGEASR